jgi:hypothetical protein
MKHGPLLPLLALALMAPWAARADETWAGSSEVKFKGYSTLHDFEGTLKAVPLKIRVAEGKNGRVVSATSDVKVRQMSTQNEKRDASMMTMFHEPEHHLLNVEVNGADERTLRPHDGQPGAMPVTLIIAGRRGTARGAVTNLVEKGDAVSFDLAFPVSLAAFKLEPPSAVGGLVKVKDTVDVTAHVTLRKTGK